MDLQNGCAYGPVVSRRLGRAIGVNLAPAGRKACNFTCAYCPYGEADTRGRSEWPKPAVVVDAVEWALTEYGSVDSIVVAGNGEPTMHPAFAPIVDGLFHLRARVAPDAKLALLTNGSTLHRPDVIGSLSRFDERRVKFDAGDATTFRLLNAPSLTLARMIRALRFISGVTVQATFVSDARRVVTNTSPHALDAWYGAIQRIAPSAVDVCTPRELPKGTSLLRVPATTLQGIAEVVRGMGIPARVFA
jgi:wyosine [tRNA(Phe)-imidazoG37] synthetase (radical SAM superfamily)